jgi:hypothetical protein
MSATSASLAARTRPLRRAAKGMVLGTVHWVEHLTTRVVFRTAKEMFDDIKVCISFRACFISNMRARTVQRSTSMRSNWSIGWTRLWCISPCTTKARRTVHSAHFDCMLDSYLRVCVLRFGCREVDRIKYRLQLELDKAYLSWLLRMQKIQDMLVDAERDFSRHLETYRVSICTSFCVCSYE